MRGNGDFSIGSDVWPGLSKLVEEIGELSQVLGKLIGAQGATNHWDGTDLITRLEEEIGDVFAAAKFFVDHNPELAKKNIDMRATYKLGLFETWHANKTTTEKGE